MGYTLCRKKSTALAFKCGTHGLARLSPARPTSSVENILNLRCRWAGQAVPPPPSFWGGAITRADYISGGWTFSKYGIGTYQPFDGVPIKISDALQGHQRRLVASRLYWWLPRVWRGRLIRSS